MYQRWVYPIDPKRSNEFGQTGEDEQQPATEAVQQTAAPSATETTTDQQVEPTSAEQPQPSAEQPASPAEQSSSPLTPEPVTASESTEQVSANPEQEAELGASKTQVRKRKATRRDE